MKKKYLILIIICIIYFIPIINNDYLLGNLDKNSTNITNIFNDLILINDEELENINGGFNSSFDDGAGPLYPHLPGDPPFPLPF